jgi:hypothetical protein
MDIRSDDQQLAPKMEQSLFKVDEPLRAIAYSMDALVPGLYFWLGAIKLRVGGSLPEDTYPGTLHSPAGIALVLPGYRIYSTYQGSYDPR